MVENEQLSATSVDIKHVVEFSEEILRCLIFRLLEKVIDQEANSGKLDFSSMPQNVCDGIRNVRQYIIDARQKAGTDMDKWVLHKIMLVLDRQVKYTMEQYHKVFYKMTYDLNLTDQFSFAYDTFERICDRMLEKKKSWYHIIALLCFAAEVAVFVVKQGGPGVESFLEQIVQYFMDYTIKNQIAEWISSHGGWLKMVDFFDQPDCPDRARHIFTIMAITEVTQLEKWLKRIAAVAVITGFGFAVYKISYGSVKT